jgi:hypothetical protein
LGKREFDFFTQTEKNKKKKFFFSASSCPHNNEYIPIKIIIFEILV